VSIISGPVWLDQLMTSFSVRDQDVRDVRRRSGYRQHAAVIVTHHKLGIYSRSSHLAAIAVRQVFVLKLPTKVGAIQIWRAEALRSPRSFN